MKLSKNLLNLAIDTVLAQPTPALVNYLPGHRYLDHPCEFCHKQHKQYSDAAACMRLSLDAYDQYRIRSNTSVAMPLFASIEAARAYLNDRDAMIERIPNVSTRHI